MTRQLHLLVIVTTLVASVSNNLAGTVSFQGLGDLDGGGFSSSAYGISRNGLVVVGASNSSLHLQAFRWTLSEGMINLGSFSGGNHFSMAYDVSNDGSVIVGRSSGSNGSESCIWENGIIKAVAYDIDDTEDAFAISANGSVVAGYGYFPDKHSWEAYRWENNVTTRLGSIENTEPPSNVLSEAYDISADGTVLVGQAISPSGYQAFRWTESAGMVGIGELPGGDYYSKAIAVSSDGLVIVGESFSGVDVEAFRWENEEMIGLGMLANIWPMPDYSIARDVSADGTVIVGESGHTAFIWDETNGIRNLKNVLELDLGLDLTGWELMSANAISDDGRIIVGEATNPDGNGEAWIATMSCPLGDFEGDGDVGFGDFGIFALAWYSEPGDLNWNEICDISEPNDIIDEFDLGLFLVNWPVGVE